MHQWWDKTYPYRIPITINAGEISRIDRVIDVEVNLSREPNQMSSETSNSGLTSYIVEVDGEGKILSNNVPCQFYPVAGDTPSQQAYTLTLYLAGLTSAYTTRHFQVYLRQQQRKDTVTLQHTRCLTLIDAVMHEGQESYRIETPYATYIYHKCGGGFASLLDRENLDWISFHPWGGSDGKYRGIPNLVYPEGYFHPGNKGCRSRIIQEGPVKVTILSESIDGLWTCTWDITPAYATLTVLQAPKAYWFLYEGTPGGVLNEKGDYIVRSSGERTPASERWEGVLPEPEWLYFGTHDKERVLYLLHHEHDDAIDSYWPMENNMTVFGFGRLNLNKYMTLTPSHFTIGFVERSDRASVSAVIDSIYNPIHIEVGGIQMVEI
jgi:hypothetical protein